MLKILKALGSSIVGQKTSHGPRDGCVSNQTRVDWLTRSNAELTLPLQIVVDTADATGRLLTSHLSKGPG